ncbi:hypothetical protein LTR04_000806 [Oleoguttula sp. CCFEE 6159]|nr:hypothetical protein LTR04_000806 [Oleoguttula sp. CCFEE 6159]
MAPIDPDLHVSSTRALVYFSSQALGVAALLAVIISTLRRAWRTLPPALNTRQHQAKRRSDVVKFAALAAVSFVLLACCNIYHHRRSYNEWTAQRLAPSPPKPLPNGLLGREYLHPTDGAEALDWEIGRWFRDTDVLTGFYKVVTETSKSFWWSQQHFAGVVAWSLFVGIEGRRRNLPKSTLLAFVLLAQATGLSVAQNLFFIAILLTPAALSEKPIRGSKFPSLKDLRAGSASTQALWTRHPALYILPVLWSFACIGSLPSVVDKPIFSYLLATGYIVLPILLSASPDLIPKRWGTTHRTTASLARSHARLFSLVALASLLLHARATFTAITTEAPPAAYTHRSFVWTTHAPATRSYLQRGEMAIGHVVGALADHPAVAAVGWDVLLSALSLGVWSVVRGVDVGAMGRCVWGALWEGSGGSSSSDSGLEIDGTAGEKEKKGTEKGKSVPIARRHNSRSEPRSPPPATASSPSLPAKRPRGRPRKDAAAQPAPPASSSTRNAPASSAASSRRSARLPSAPAAPAEVPDSDFDPDSDSDSDPPYVPSPSTAHAAAQLPHDAAEHAETAAQGAEEAGVAWGLFVLGGLGAAGAGVLGGTVAGG